MKFVNVWLRCGL